MADVLKASRDVKEKLRTYDPAFNELLGISSGTSAGQNSDSLRSASAPSRRQPSQHRPASQPMPGDQTLQRRLHAQRALRDALAQQAADATRAHAAEVRAARARRKDEAFQASYSQVLEGLTHSSGVMGDTHFSLAFSQKTKAEKATALHQEWTAEVFDKMQTRLQSQVEARPPATIERRLRSQYDQYLHTTNTKVGVFRDVIIEEDYNPLAARGASIRIPVGDVNDPLLRDVTKPERERQLMGQSLPQASLGKETLNNKMWGSLEIKATPYGHCMDATGDYVVRPLSQGTLKARASRIPSDHYDFPTGNDAAASEMDAVYGKGKFIAPGPEKRRGRQNLTDVVQHTCNLQPKGYTGGDLWLEARGKAQPVGPEVRRGRVGLGVILSQSTTSVPNNKTVGHAVGDLWIDAKGKAAVPGPEIKLGRPNLFETFQNASNPYEDRRTLGDSWLEYKGRRPAGNQDNDVRTILAQDVCISAL